MYIVRVVVDRLSDREMSGAQHGCESAKARLAEEYPLREMGVFCSGGSDKYTRDGKMEILLALEPTTQREQMTSLMDDLSAAVGVDLAARSDDDEFDALPQHPRSSTCTILV